MCVICFNIIVNGEGFVLFCSGYLFEVQKNQKSVSIKKNSQACHSFVIAVLRCPG